MKITKTRKGWQRKESKKDLMEYMRWTLDEWMFATKKAALEYAYGDDAVKVTLTITCETTED